MCTGHPGHQCVSGLSGPLPDPFEQMDKLVDELARGRAMEKVLRA